MHKKNLTHWFCEIIGWYGVFGIMLAYGLVSFEVVSPTDVLYQVLNITGGIGIVIISFYKRAYQPGVLNVIWALIGLAALTKILLNP